MTQAAGLQQQERASRRTSRRATASRGSSKQVVVALPEHSRSCATDRRRGETSVWTGRSHVAESRGRADETGRDFGISLDSVMHVSQASGIQ